MNEQPRTSYELEAMAVGHDLARGVSKFERVYRNAGAITVAVDEQGIPADDSDHWHDLSEPSDSDGFDDPGAGVAGPVEEVRELTAV